MQGFLLTTLFVVVTAGMWSLLYQQLRKAMPGVFAPENRTMQSLLSLVGPVAIAVGDPVLFRMVGVRDPRTIVAATLAALILLVAGWLTYFKVRWRRQP